MNYEEFAFVNQQLAGMLKAGIPLESGLKELCRTLRKGTLRSELELLRGDLEEGTPLSEALKRRNLPPLYVALLTVGQAGNDLPGVLTMAADYFEKMNQLWTRLKGLMVYPALLLAGSFLVSLLVAIIFSRLFQSTVSDLSSTYGGGQNGPWSRWVQFQTWMPVGLFTLTILVIAILLRSPRVRDALRWKLPGFREAALSHTAGMMSLMLSRGCPMPEAARLIQQLEPGHRLAQEMVRWQQVLAGGGTHFSELTSHSPLIPPLFTWLVAGGGQDWGSGFRRAAQLYYSRALHKIDLLLYAVLPVSIVVMGFLVLSQVSTLYVVYSRIMYTMMEPVGGF